MSVQARDNDTQIEIVLHKNESNSLVHTAQWYMSSHKFEWPRFAPDAYIILVFVTVKEALLSVDLISKQGCQDTLTHVWNQNKN